MPTYILIATILVLSVIGYYMGRSTAVARNGGKSKGLHSLPGYYGYYMALWCALPALALAFLWLVFQNSIIEGMVLGGVDVQNPSLFMTDVKNYVENGIASGGVTDTLVAAADRYVSLKQYSAIMLSIGAIALAVVGLAYSQTRVGPTLRSRPKVEKALMIALMAASTIAILTTVGIILSLLFESALFFEKVPLTEFLFGIQWSPQTAMRADQVGSSGTFGAVPLFAGTLLITAIAMAVAAPIGLMSAIYMSEYADRRVRSVLKPLLEVLAGIPTVVYGFFAALTVAPFVRTLGQSVGLDVASESALAAGVVMGIMIVPFVSSLSDDVMTAVPQAMRDGSYGLGATKSETIKRVILPAALPGIVGAVMLAISRAIGETMIVVMAAGLSANLTANPFEAVTTVTVQIATLLVGDQEFDSPKTLATFALGLVLFVVTLILNIIALRIVRKYREQYE
ncbi:phosphate ABC transporter permease subunit PstC [Zavarzinia compransoris]|uniref:phosphate ABC transporter permease subunit PstC n=1 Tax=Zavarzinia marina TaxID=2911065 RepID=UPI001F408745|nr:phosphate ABC transporter permease subunit PstC [Zavarzinia marina]MCF4165412.1 phosphate ABC transporter permease subunit PstC [Zavarzinia marina]